MCVYRVYYSSRVVPNVLSIALMFSFYEWVDILPPLNLHKRSGKVVLELSEVGKPCLRQDATSFAENRKNACDIFCQKRQKMRVTSFVRAAHIPFVWYTRASQANS